MWNFLFFFGNDASANGFSETIFSRTKIYKSCASSTFFWQSNGLIADAYEALLKTGERRYKTLVATVSFVRAP